MGFVNAKAYLAAIDKAIADYDPDLALAKRAKKEQEELDALYEKGSEQAGVSAKALENYSKALEKNIGSLKNNKKAAAACAIANATFAEGVEKLGEVLDKNSSILTNWNEASLDTYEAVAEVQEVLEKVLGVEVSYDYVKKYLADIRDLANGDTEALEQLRVEAAKDYVLNLGIDENSASAVTSVIDELVA
jgi:hypothetical protein